jgi:hypothetical protein
MQSGGATCQAKVTFMSLALRTLLLIFMLFNSAPQNHIQAGLVLLNHDFSLVDPGHEEDPDLVDRITQNVTVTNNRFQKNGYAPGGAPPIIPLLYGDIVYMVGGQEGNCFAGNKYKSAAMLTLGAGGFPEVQRFKPPQFNAMFPCA